MHFWCFATWPLVVLFCATICWAALPKTGGARQLQVARFLYFLIGTRELFCTHVLVFTAPISTLLQCSRPCQKKMVVESVTIFFHSRANRQVYLPQALPENYGRKLLRYSNYCIPQDWILTSAIANSFESTPSINLKAVDN